jgi:hypothetical protein
MNMKISKTFAIALIALAVAVFAAIPDLQAQVVPTTYANLAQVPATVAASTTLATNSAAIPLRRDQGLAILPAFVCNATDASAASVTFTLQLSADGTNYTTTGPLTYAVAANSTNTVVGYKLFIPDVINNVRYARISGIQNATTNTITITRIQYSYFN